MSPVEPLAGHVALITGASRRIAIGAAIARRLAGDGAAVVVHGYAPHDAAQPWGADEGGVEALVAELAAQGARAAHLSGDLALPGAPESCLEYTIATFGSCDILVAAHARSSAQRLGELTAMEIDYSYAVNTRATLLLIQAFAAARSEGSGGRVITFTSGQHHSAMPEEIPYIASKGALHQLTSSLAVALAATGVTVNCIDPGPTDTGYATEALQRVVAEQIPAGRWGQPVDTARLVAWLVSDEASWVTGQVIASDGGWSSR